MTCREAANLLPLFFDGELDPRQMRAVALHSTRCTTCEQDLRQLERMQELISDNVSRAVEGLDFEQFWSTIERRLPAVREPWGARVREWWSATEHPWMLRLPAFAAAMAIAVVALVLFTRGTQTTVQPAAPQLAAADNATTIDFLDSDVDSVAVLNDPETRTMVLWVNDVQTGDLP
jgi:anti-sigma factor RsiW